MAVRASRGGGVSRRGPASGGGQRRLVARRVGDGEGEGEDRGSEEVGGSADLGLAAARRATMARTGGLTCRGRGAKEART